jgi:hypothetical protein
VEGNGTALNGTALCRYLAATTVVVQSRVPFSLGSSNDAPSREQAQEQTRRPPAEGRRGQAALMPAPGPQCCVARARVDPPPKIHGTTIVYVSPPTLDRLALPALPGRCTLPGRGVGQAELLLEVAKPDLDAASGGRTNPSAVGGSIRSGASASRRRSIELMPANFVGERPDRRDGGENPSRDGIEDQAGAGARDGASVRSGTTFPGGSRMRVTARRPNSLGASENSAFMAPPVHCPRQRSSRFPVAPHSIAGR